MPQQSLLPDHPAMTRLNLLVESWPHTKFPDHVRLTVQIGEGTGDPASAIVVVLQGVEADFLNTIVEDAVSAYMYGEKPRDVRQAVNDVWRLARAHGASHQF